MSICNDRHTGVVSLTLLLRTFSPHTPPETAAFKNVAKINGQRTLIYCSFEILMLCVCMDGFCYFVNSIAVCQGRAFTLHTLILRDFKTQT